MSLESVACNRCGNLLDLAPGVRFVTCRSCNTTLAVRRSESSAWTETTTEDRLDRIEENVDRLGVRDDLDILDRQWEREREEYMITSGHGVRSLPNKTVSVIGGVVVAGFGILWTIFAYSVTAGMGGGFDGSAGLVGSIFPLFGLVFIAFGVGMSMWSYQQAEKYELARARYEERRASIEAKLRR